MDAIKNLVARHREARRRAAIESLISRIERKLDRIGPNPCGLRRDRAFRLVAQVQKLRGELAQPELLL
ncbi:MAG: hypothetical protein ACLPQ0_05315 [Candidatus Binatus sp.]